MTYYAEDYQGRYWELVDIGHGGQRARRLPCAGGQACTCDHGIEIVQDVLGQWYARHQTHTGVRWYDRGRVVASTVSSPRFDDWQDAAQWAADHGLLHPGAGA